MISDCPITCPHWGWYRYVGGAVCMLVPSSLVVPYVCWYPNVGTLVAPYVCWCRCSMLVLTLLTPYVTLLVPTGS